MASWTNKTKNNTSWTNISKSFNWFGFLLKEDGGNLLLESEGKIALENAEFSLTSWKTQTKHTTSWTHLNKS